MNFKSISKSGEFSTRPKQRYNTAENGISHNEAMMLYLAYKESGNIIYRNKIIDGCMRRIQWLASQMSFSDSIPLEDLIQEASIGFMKGIERYDIKKATTPRGTIKIINHCFLYAKKAIFEYYEAHSHNIRLPALVHRAVSKIDKRLNEYMREYQDDRISNDALFPEKFPFIRAGIVVYGDRQKTVCPVDASDMLIAHDKEGESDYDKIISLLMKEPIINQSITMSFLGYNDDSVIDFDRKRDSHKIAFEDACFMAGINAGTGLEVVTETLNSIRTKLLI